MSREVRLAARPQGMPTPSDFTLAETPNPTPDEGQVLVRNLYFSVDPYMRGRMNDVTTYVEPYQVGRPLDGRCVGRVLESLHPDFAPGDLVRSFLGWREQYAAPPEALEKLDSAHPHPSHYLSALGGTGLTAYVGLVGLCEPQPGETVFVSSAAGAVGSVAGQIARVKGCRVVGSAGSDDKVRIAREEFRFHDAFNYKTTDPGAALAALAPDGIDVYFDNVGGRHLEAALDALNDFGRIAACGAISAYNAADLPPGPRNLANIVRKRLRLQGFIVRDHLDRQPAFEADMRRWMADGDIVVRETLVDGIENAVQAFIGLFRGDNVGKMLVRLPDAS